MSYTFIKTISFKVSLNVTSNYKHYIFSVFDNANIDNIIDWNIDLDKRIQIGKKNILSVQNEKCK